MTDEQKRFKIQKKEHYNEQISQENKEAIKNTFLLGITAVGAMVYYTAMPNERNEIIQYIYLSLGLADMGLSAYWLKNLIESISRKTNLENKVDDIKSELEMLEGKESRGMR